MQYQQPQQQQPVYGAPPQQGYVYGQQPYGQPQPQPYGQQQYAQPVYQQPQQQVYSSPPVQQQPYGVQYQPQQPLHVQPQPQQYDSSQLPQQPVSPSTVAPTQAFVPMNVSSSDSASDTVSKDENVRNDPKLCFCIEPDSNLSEEKRAKKYKYHVPCSIVSGCASFVLLILAIVALQKITDFTDAYGDILSTWKNQPVYDVTFVSSLTACPTGYITATETWGGTYSACVCPAPNQSNSTDTTACTTDQRSISCADRTGYAPVDFSIHPQLKMCLRRAGVNALDRTRADSDGTCPSGTLSCSLSGSTDVYCEPNNIQVGGVAVCPLTDFALAGDVSVAATPSVTKTSLGIIDGAPLYMYTTRTGSIPESVLPLAQRSSGSLPITTMPLTDVSLVSGQPCLISSTCYYGDRASEYAAQEAAVQAGSSGRGYKLKDAACTGCRSPPSVPGGSVSPGGEDIRYVKGFTRRESLVFADAGVPAAYVTSNTKYEWTIQTRSEVKWVNSCEKTKQDIAGQENFVKHIKNFQVTLLVVSILTFIIFSLFIPIIDWKTKGHWTDNRKAWYVKTFLNLLFKAFVISFTLATMFVSLGVLSYWTKVDGSTDKATCSDKLSTEVFKILSDDYRSLSYSNVGSTVAMGTSGMLDFFGQVLWCFSK